MDSAIRANKSLALVENPAKDDEVKVGVHPIDGGLSELVPVSIPHWAPADIDERVPPVTSDAPCPLTQVLQRPNPSRGCESRRRTLLHVRRPGDTNKLLEVRAMNCGPLSEMIRSLACRFFSLARSRILSMSASFIDSRRSQCTRKRLHPSSTLHK